MWRDISYPSKRQNALKYDINGSKRNAVVECDCYTNDLNGGETTYIKWNQDLSIWTLTATRTLKFLQNYELFHSLSDEDIRQEHIHS